MIDYSGRAKSAVEGEGAGSRGIAGDDFQRFRKSPFGLSRHGYSKRKFDRNLPCCRMTSSLLTKNQKRKGVSRAPHAISRVYIKDA